MKLKTPKSGYTFAHLKFQTKDQLCLQKSVLMDLGE